MNLDRDKIMIAGAVECHEDGTIGRIRLNVIRSRGREALHAFLGQTTAPGTLIMTDGNTAYRRIPDRQHEEIPIPKLTPAHIVLKQIHRVFSLLKRWSMGVYHGLRKKHAEAYLQECVYRFNRRRHYRSSFKRLLGLGIKVGRQTWWDITGRQPVFRDLKQAVAGQDADGRDNAIKRAILADVPLKYARLRLDPAYQAAPKTYDTGKPKLPVLAKELIAFAVEAF